MAPKQLEDQARGGVGAAPAELDQLAGLAGRNKGVRHQRLKPSEGKRPSSARDQGRIGHVDMLCTPLGYALACHVAVRRGKALGSASHADGTAQIVRLRELGAPE